MGSTLSSMVTVLVQLSELPLGSVTVSVTVLVPTLEQVKEVGVTESDTEQLSLLPLLTSDAAKFPLPLASN